MIAILKSGTTPEQTQHLVSWLKTMNLDVHISHGAEVTILGLIGDTSRVDMELLNSLEIVESVKRVSEPFKQANRKFHPQDSVIEAGGSKIGGGYFGLIAGPLILLKGLFQKNELLAISFSFVLIWNLLF